MKIGLFSGSFSPIHNGHLRLAEYMIQEFGLDELWLVVSPNNPLKSPSQLWDEKLRIHLAEIATANTPKIQVSDIETKLPKPSYTVNTLRTLKAEYPQNEFWLIIGSDNMAIFHLWKDWKYILDNFSILVYPRQGDDLSELTKRYPQMKVAWSAPMFDVSSTMIRKLLQEGKSIKGLVAEGVEKEIRSEKLYDWSV